MTGLQWREHLGVLRSMVMYYGAPWRFRRMRELYGRFIGPGDLCFDIGAHVGNRLHVWTTLGARTVAVEPQPQLMRWLERLYGNRSNIDLLEIAVGAEEGTAALHISSRTPTVTSMSQEWMQTVQEDPSFGSVRWDRDIIVEVTTLDALIARFGCPAFCKIDVEGFELDVLRGLSEPLPALSFEYVAASVGSAIACIERLRELGQYEFNHSPGETHRLHSERWLSAPEMLATLQRIAGSSGSGDVYARLRDRYA